MFSAMRKYEQQAYLHVASVVFFLLALATPAAPQTDAAKQSPTIFEIRETTCVIPCLTTTIRVYADGRLTHEGETAWRPMSGRLRKASVKLEMQLEPNEVAKLTDLAERPDFLNAQAEYAAMTVTDQPHSFVVIYRNGGRNKQIKIYNFFAPGEAEKSKIPASLSKLLELVVNGNL